MPELEIREMGATDEYFVGTCTHVNESREMDVCGARRIAWLRRMQPDGVIVEVAFLDGERVGFIYAMPIEVSPWGPLGQDLLFIPCLVARSKVKGRGVGRALIHEIEEEAKHQGFKGLVTTAYCHNLWFMPAPFFEHLGFSVARRRGVPVKLAPFLDAASEEVILWKVLDSSAKAPRFLEPNYQFKPIPGKVVVDLFWNRFCQTSEIEAERVRGISGEFGDRVVLHEYPAHEKAVLLNCQIPRGIFINGKEIGWGHEAPKDGIREAIQQVLEEV